MMIAPTRRATLLVATGAPVALVLGVIFPAYWTVGLIWALFLVALMLLDAVLCAPGGKVVVAEHASPTVSVGEAFEVDVAVTFPAKALVTVPGIALSVSEIIDPGTPVRADLAMQGAEGRAQLLLTPSRRGQARISDIWVRWHGPMGLVAQQRRFATNSLTLVTPDARPVRSEGIRMFQRDAMHGLIAQLERGEGTDFEALADFQPGMDKRAIDWKQSARHSRLLAKEYRTERDNRIVFAVDCGRAMSEPLAGVPRVDRAVTAALLTSWTAMKLGDRASLFAFDSRPRLHSGALSGVENFAHLQKLAAKIDYSTEETNHTFALSSLAQQLSRRALIILFTDFTDPTGADLMVRAVGWLLARHVVLFVIMRDADLEEIIEGVPVDPGAVAKAVTAAALMNEQRKVIARLRRLGLEVVEASHEQLGLKLVSAYIALKQKGRL